MRLCALHVTSAPVRRPLAHDLQTGPESDRPGQRKSMTTVCSSGPPSVTLGALSQFALLRPFFPGELEPPRVDCCAGLVAAAGAPALPAPESGRACSPRGRAVVAQRCLA